MAESQTPTDDESTQNNRITALEQVFHQSDEHVFENTGPSGDYKVEFFDTCITPTDRTALSAMGFKQEHTHAHVEEVAGEEVATMVLYVTDTRSEGGR